MTLSELLLEKLKEFEGVAKSMMGARRSIVKSRRGVEQHLVRNKIAILRWPTSYAHAKIACVRPKVRWEPLRVEVDW